MKEDIRVTIKYLLIIGFFVVVSAFMIGMFCAVSFITFKWLLSL